MSEKRKLRAVGYCRTSSTSQKDNTSIPNQKAEISALAAREKWELVGWYVDESKSGSKIAGREEFLRMMRDAAAGIFDVVVVFDIKRYGRDGFDILESSRTLKRDFSVDVVDTKGFFDTRGRNRTLPNFVQAAVAEDERISILERTKHGKIRVAREHNAPIGNKLPFGRSWDRAAKEWRIDPEAKRIIEDAAERYVSGESMANLADEYGLKHWHLHKILTQRCGPVWVQNVRCKELGIDEQIETQIPPLLDEATIRKVLLRIEANRTYAHGEIKNRYLLSRMVFCSHCGYAMFGQTNANGARYYRHAHAKRERPCDVEKTWIPAADLENTVIRYLFEMFGNPASVQRAIEDAIPDLEQVKKSRERLTRLDCELEKIGRGRDQLLGLVESGDVSPAEVRPRLRALQERSERLREEREGLESDQGNIPTPEQSQAVATRLAEMTREMNRALEDMTYEESRALVEAVFGGRTRDGRRMGVYLKWTETGGDPWLFDIDGHLIHHADCPPLRGNWLNWFFELDPEPAKGQKELMRVTSCASRLRGTARRGRRSPRSAARLPGESRRSPAAAAPPSRARG